MLSNLRIQYAHARKILEGLEGKQRVCTYKPVACLPNLLKFFWHERSEFLNCAAIFTTKKSKGSCTIHQLKKVMYKCALALFFARNINFEKVMCKCALFLE